MNFYGLFGESLSHSLSPALHKKIYQKAGIDAAYKPFAFPPADIAKAVDGIKVLTINGVNVTIPYKEKVLPHLDEMDAFAEKLQAVNTIQNQNGKLKGFNTDYDGFGLIFRRRDWPIKDKTAVILGTGGAAKISKAYLLDQGAQHVTILSRSPERFENTGTTTYTNYESIQKLSGDYLINTTPVGMYPHTADSPVSESVVRRFDTLIDLVYNPAETMFLSFGQKQQKQTANGLDMLVGQAVKSVEIWENCKIKDNIIDELIEELGDFI